MYVKHRVSVSVWVCACVHILLSIYHITLYIVDIGLMEYL